MGRAGQVAIGSAQKVHPRTAPRISVNKLLVSVVPCGWRGGNMTSIYKNRQI